MGFHLDMEIEGIGKNERLLVLSIDRDNDIGQKTAIKGPVIGREGVLKTANKLGLADPEDTDFNALFEAVRIFDELKKSVKADKNLEIAAITGDKDRSIKSDFEIGRQLDIVLKKYKATGVVLITDGSDDEHTIPIIQNKVPIKTVRRLVVRQADQLESSYFKIKDFIDESLSNPRLSSIVFGLPAVILILLGIFGIAGGRYVLLLLGAFLVIKWLKLEKHITGASEELRSSLTRRRFAAFFVYVLAVVIGILGIYRGYTFMQGFLDKSVFEIAASFISSSVFLLWITVVIGWFGWSAYRRTKDIGRVVSIPLFSFAVALVLFGAADTIIIHSLSLTYFLLYIILGGLLILLSVVIDKVAFPEPKAKPASGKNKKAAVKEFVE